MPLARISGAAALTPRVSQNGVTANGDQDMLPPVAIAGVNLVLIGDERRGWPGLLKRKHYRLP